MVVDSGGSVGATWDVVVGVSVSVEMGVPGMMVGWIRVVVYEEVHGGGCGEAGESVDVGVNDGSNGWVGVSVDGDASDEGNGCVSVAVDGGVSGTSSGWTAIATPEVGISGMVG